MTVFHDLAMAVIVGVIVSALVFAWDQGTKIRFTTETNKNGSKSYHCTGALFFGSATSFKEIFDIKQDPSHVVIDLKNARVYDHSGLDALQNIIDRYAKVNKTVMLLHVSKECRDLLTKAKNLVDVKIIENLDWHIATDQLA